MHKGRQRGRFEFRRLRAARHSAGKGLLARIFRCPRGVVSIEAALIFPVMILLIMGTIEFALLFFTYSSLQTAVRDVARQISVNFADPSSAQTAVSERIPSWSQGAVTVTMTQTNPGDPNNNVITLSASLPASSATPLNFLTNTIGDFILQTHVEMKQEPAL